MMTRRTHLRPLLLAGVLALVLAAPAVAQAPRPADAGAVVLDTLSPWRMFHTLKPPVVDADGQMKPYLRNIAWLDGATPDAFVTWMQTDFNDASWFQSTARGGCQTPYLANQYLRGKFEVTNPAQVRGLTLSLDYHGGAVVYLNGKELTRKNLPAGAIGENTLADKYPLEAFVTASGDLLAEESTYIADGRKAGRPDAESQKRIDSRVRSIKDFPIPSAALRKGVNVLAIELVRSPFHKVMLETPEQAGSKLRRNKYDWYTCELHSVRLTAPAAAGLVSNAARPAGFQVWNSDVLAADGKADRGDLCEPLRPIVMVGARNGSYSGKVVVGSSKAITGLKAAAGDLKGPGGSIPASAVRVRYGYVWGGEAGYTSGEGGILPPYPRWSPFFGALVDAPPAEVAVNKAEPPLQSGAVQSIWVTVRTPKDAKPGLYTGELRIIAAGGEKPLAVAVPVRMEIVDCTLPDPQDYRTWVELIQSPDTLSVEYEAPLWSEKHFNFIAQSFRLMTECGTRVVHVPLIAHTNLGNAESMIRWIKKGEKQYTWDFTVMDKYLDLAQKNLGTPKIVVLQVWDIYMSTPDSVGKRFSPELQERQKNSGGAPYVTMLNRETGKTENMAAPGLMDPASKAIWQALLKEVRDHLKQRGIEKALMFGMFTDAIPPKEHIQFFHDLAPDVPWVQQGHGLWRAKVHGISEVGYQASVWGGFRFGDGQKQTNQEAPGVVASLLGWKRPRIDAVFERNTDLDNYPSSRWRFYAETGITSDLRGVGRIGADYWRVVKNKQGRRVGWAHERFSDGAWGGSWIQVNLCSATLAPGPDGPATTNRLLAMTEGVQECEARIMIERALSDDALKARLGTDLATRAQALLDKRLHTMWRTLSNFQLGGPFFFGAGGWRWAAGIPGHRWYLGSSWQQDSKELYELAGQVAGKTGQ